MKNLLKIILLLASLNLGAQISGVEEFMKGLAIPNATEVTTATKIPALDTNLKMNTWISPLDLISGGSGTVNYLSKFTATGLSDSQIFDNGTNVGIGTATPNASMEIVNTDPTKDYFRLGSSVPTSGDIFRVASNGSFYLGGVITDLGVNQTYKYRFNSSGGRIELSGKSDLWYIIGSETYVWGYTADANIIGSENRPILSVRNTPTVVNRPKGVEVLGSLYIKKDDEPSAQLYDYDVSAQLQVDSKTKGFLPPRMTEVEKNAITSPAEGLMIYQTDATKGWYGFDGTAWGELGLISTIAKGEFRSLVDQYANDVTETLIDFEVRIGLQNVEWDNTNKTIKNTSQNDITLHLEPQIGRRSTGSVAEIEIWVDISDDGINWDPLDGYAIFKNITNSTSSVAPLTTVLAPNQYARFGMILDTNVSDTGIISNGQGATNPGASLSGRVVPSVELNITNN